MVGNFYYIFGVSYIISYIDDGDRFYVINCKNYGVVFINYYFLGSG